MPDERIVNAQSGQGTVNAQPGQGTVNAQPGQGTVNAQPGQGTVNAQPGQGTVNAQPGQGTVNAQPGQGTVNAQPGQGTVNAQPGQGTVNAQPGQGTVNAMTVDVEDWFQVQAFAGTIPRDDWESLPRRVEANTDRFLALFADAGVRATFFTLGWVADRHPTLIRRIVAAGHELASHGYAHRLAHEQTEAEFREDVGRAKRILEDTGGVPVRGYRAPTFSIGTRNLWAFKALSDEGYTYSSSLFPISHDLYGMPDAPRLPFRPDAPGLNGRLLEIPMTTVRIAGRNLPCAGGGYFRLVPYALFRAGLRRFNRAEAASGMFYTHPWEIDPGQPEVPAAPRMARFRHRVNLARTHGRIALLLRDFAWDRVDRVFAPALNATIRA